MSSKLSPIFPMQETQHFTDYGFDPHINYFQFLEEARKHKKETKTTRMSSIGMDSFHFKLQKPISKDYVHDHYSYSARKTHTSKICKKKKWWRSAMYLFKWKKWASYKPGNHSNFDQETDVHKARARAFRSISTSSSGGSSSNEYTSCGNNITSISGPVYFTESRSIGSTSPYYYRTTSRPSSGPIAGTLTPARRGDVDMPYLSLRQLTMEQQQQQRISASSASMPIYLVT